MAQFQQLAARAAIALESERQPDRRDRLADDMHDLLLSVMYVLEEAGVPLPDPNSVETARAAWM